MFRQKILFPIHMWEVLFPIFGSVAQSTQGVTSRPRSSCDLRETRHLCSWEQRLQRIVCFLAFRGRRKHQSTIYMTCTPSCGFKKSFDVHNRI